MITQSQFVSIAHVSSVQHQESDTKFGLLLLYFLFTVLICVGIVFLYLRFTKKQQDALPRQKNLFIKTMQRLAQGSVLIMLMLLIIYLALKGT